MLKTKQIKDFFIHIMKIMLFMTPETANNNKGLAIQNIFTGIFSFFIGVIMIYAIGPIMYVIQPMISDYITRMIVLIAWLLLCLVITIYLPLKFFTAKDEQLPG